MSGATFNYSIFIAEALYYVYQADIDRNYHYYLSYCLRFTMPMSESISVGCKSYPPLWTATSELCPIKTRSRLVRIEAMVDVICVMANIRRR